MCVAFVSLILHLIIYKINVISHQEKLYLKVIWNEHAARHQKLVFDANILLLWFAPLSFFSNYFYLFKILL